MRKLILVIMAALAALAVFVLVRPAGQAAAAAPVEITIDDEEYNVYTDNFPDPIGDDVYAKFTSSVKDVDEYYLYFDQEAAEESFKTALDKNKIEYNEDFICYMKTFLYKYSEDGDDTSVTSQKLEIYFPLPLDAQEHAEDCAFYKLSSGKLTQVYPLQLYKIDDIPYIRMTMTSATDYSAYYGFVYTDPESYEEEDDEDAYEDEDEDEDDYGDGEEDEDGEEEDEDEPTPTPTKAPTVTATPTPTQAPTSAPKATATPTPASNSGNGGNGGGNGNNSGKKDSTPKTGDNFPLGLTLTGIFLSMGAIIFAVTKLKKR